VITQLPDLRIVANVARAHELRERDVCKEVVVLVLTSSSLVAPERLNFSSLLRPVTVMQAKRR